MMVYGALTVEKASRTSLSGARFANMQLLNATIRLLGLSIDEWDCCVGRSSKCEHLCDREKKLKPSSAGLAAEKMRQKCIIQGSSP